MQDISSKSYFEDQYVLRKSLPSFMEHVEEWEALGGAEELADRSSEIVRYGAHPRQDLELFRVQANTQSKGLAVFLHGGFWRAMDRQQSRFLALPFLRNGYDCAIAEYRLMPEFRLSDLVDDAATMLARLLARDLGLSRNVVLAGHSAGAHLAFHGLNAAQRAGVMMENASLILFSGVFDIHPVARTSIGDELKMSASEIARWSLYPHLGGVDHPPVFVVGGNETAEFKRQSILAANLLMTSSPQPVRFIDEANHLTVMTKFATDDEISKRLIGIAEASV